jgi:putative ABC transport system ATP-binding protein
MEDTHHAKLVLAARGVSKQYEVESGVVLALSNISLSAHGGEMIALRGPSGCGKSTLLSILGLLIEPTCGELLLNGVEVPFKDESRLTILRRSRIGFIFQYFNLLPSLSAIDNVVLTLLLNGHSRAEARDRAADLLKTVGLVNRMNHLPSRLSGGEMQRVAVCRALAHHPDCILADEPTGNLDSVAGSAVLDLLLESRLRGAAVIVATHSEVAASQCDRIVNLKDGVITL